MCRNIITLSLIVNILIFTFSILRFYSPGVKDTTYDIFPINFHLTSNESVSFVLPIPIQITEGKIARIKKNRPRQSNPISRSDAMDEADELSAVIYSVSRFFLACFLAFSFNIVSNLRKLQKLFSYS